MIKIDDSLVTFVLHRGKGYFDDGVEFGDEAAGFGWLAHSK